MEFASCWQSTGGVTNFPLEDYEAIDWTPQFWADQWSNMRFNMRLLAPTNHQISREVRELFFGQPFRFTSWFGWEILYHFLLNIGPIGRGMLKRIAVCHPGFFVPPNGLGPQQPEPNSRYWSVDTCLLRYLGFDQQRRGGGTAEDSAFAGTLNFLEDGQTLPSEDTLWNIRRAFRGPCDLMKDAKGLARLSLLLPPLEDYGRVLSVRSQFHDLHDHPIFTDNWFQRDGLTCEIVYLTHASHVCDAPFGVELVRSRRCLSELRGKLAAHRDQWNRAIPLEDDLLRTPEDDEEAQKFFQEAECKGWKVTEILYDDFHNYPAKPHELCMDQELCYHVSQHEHWYERPYECRGDASTKERHQQRHRKEMRELQSRWTSTQENADHQTQAVTNAQDHSISWDDEALTVSGDSTW